MSAEPTSPVDTRDPLAGRIILLVEDEVLIAMDLAATLEDAGAEVHHARNLAESLRLTETTTRFDAAILDVNLGRGETCAPVAEVLKKRATPFVLHSGDMERRGEVVSGLSAPLVKKPSAPEEVVRALLLSLAPD